MSLGERICRLRTAKNMSQGDLAEALDVSRQSISKWETDGATPELDKLVKLAALFEVTLDELVTGAPPKTEERKQADAPPQVIVERQGMPGRKMAAAILFCMAFGVLLLFTVANAFWAGVLFGIPFLVCGLICWNAKKHPGLWCAWALFLMADVFLRYGTGLSWAQVRYTFLWEKFWNYTRLAVAWCQFLGGLGLLAATAVKLGKAPMEWTKEKKRLAVLGGVLFALLCLPLSTWIFQIGGLSVSGLVSFVAWLQDSLRLALLTALLTAVLRGKRKV